MFSTLSLNPVIEECGHIGPRNLILAQTMLEILCVRNNYLLDLIFISMLGDM